MTRSFGSGVGATARYIDAALDREVDKLRAASPGSRALTAFSAAAAVGRFVPTGEIDLGAARDLLLEAAVAAGLPEREALGHIKRGLTEGQKTPRSIPSSGPPPRLSRTGPTAQSGLRPPAEEIRRLWDCSRPISSDSDAIRWFGIRFRDQSNTILGGAEDWDLVRAIPIDLPLPRWASYGGMAWNRNGYRLLFRLWDAKGHQVSFRVRCIDPTQRPKSLAPTGYSVKGLILADPLGVQLLSGAALDWWHPKKLVIAEGEPDWVVWAARQSGYDADGPTYFGIESGAWSQQIADRIPDRAHVVIRTHHDEAGEHYARNIVDTLRNRCAIFRSQSEETA